MLSVRGTAGRCCVPRSSLQGRGSSVGGASCSWSLALKSADRPDPLGSSNPCVSLGAWGLAFHTHRRAGPTESFPSTAGSFRTGSLEPLRGTGATPLPSCLAPVLETLL